MQISQKFLFGTSANTVVSNLNKKPWSGFTSNRNEICTGKTERRRCSTILTDSFMEPL
jgi:hypothetical protein